MTILEYQVTKSFVNDIQRAVAELVEWEAPTLVLQAAIEELAVASTVLTELLAAATVRDHEATMILSAEQLARIAESN